MMLVTEIAPVRVRQRRRTISGVSRAEIASQPAGDVEIPPEPTERERALHDEQQVYRTEQLMLQGIFHVRELMPLLGVADPRKMRRYIERVRSRWALEGKSRNLSEERGKAIAELEWITRQFRTLYETSATVREKGAILESLSRLREKKNAIMGLTIERAQALNFSSAIDETDLRGMVQQKDMARMLTLFASLAAEEMEAGEQCLDGAAEI
ncbi:MAG: hypothetical protein EOP09_00120 [Proteobacteria bacterium]|nr:MAG: hypothetical protein EOP09_00120 [Pseudomonadota bacterium]